MKRFDRLVTNSKGKLLLDIGRRKIKFDRWRKPCSLWTYDDIFPSFFGLPHINLRTLATNLTVDFLDCDWEV